MRMPWLLDGSDYGDGRPGDPPVAEFLDVAGLFEDRPPPRPLEHFTLLGATLTGPLPSSVTVHPVHRGDPPGCQRYSAGACSCDQYLNDVVVVGARGPDLQLTGRIEHTPERGHRAVEEKPVAEGFELRAGGDTVIGRCADTVGVHREMPPDWRTRVTLLGCRPAPQLLAAIRRPRIPVAGEICSVAFHGGAVTTLPGGFSAHVVEARPSALGEGLLDVELDDGFDSPSLPAAREIWELWQRTGPLERNLWTGYDPPMRHEWAGAAMRHSSTWQSPDRPPGATYHLDGRHVTDLPGFHCALGEAINGPGGYFGWNLDAVIDCLRGGFGAATPFTLVWSSSDVARQALEPLGDRPAVAYLTGLLTAGGADVVLR